ncbi:hypothetical protein MRX96_020315 [Rhipicephalus microplus]
MLNALLTFLAMVSWLSANAPVFPNPPCVPGPVRELQSWSFELPWNRPNPPGNLAFAASCFAWQQPPASTSSVTWPERTQYIPASDDVCSGHNTACQTMLNALLTFQAMVSWLSANTPVFPNPPRVPGQVRELQSWSFELPWNPRNPPGNPVLATSRFAWQQPLASTSSVTWPKKTQYIPASHTVCSGHNTACHTMLNALLTFQAMVSWLSANAPVFPNPPRVPEPVRELQSWSFELPWNPPNPPGNPVLAASRFAWQQPPASTSLVPWPERTQYIPASDDVCSGHNTACHTMLSALLTCQAMVS